jgi:hypothetical protein
MTQENILPTDAAYNRTPEEAAALGRRDLATIHADEMSDALALDDQERMIATVRQLRRHHARELTAWLASSR